MAQVAVGVIGLGCAVALLLLREDRPQVTQPPALGAIDPSTQSQHQRGAIVMIGRKTTITYERSREYEDGRTRYETVRIKVDDENPFDLSAGSLEAKLKAGRDDMPDELHLADGLELRTPSGLHLTADRGTYRGSTETLTVPGKVAFGRDRMSGSGTGAVHRRKTNTLELLADARVTVAPDAAGLGGLTASSTAAVLNRGDHVLHLDGAAVLQMEAQTLQAGKISATLREDEQAVTAVRLVGNASVAAAVGSKNPVPGMKGDAIDLTLRPDGRTVQRAVLASAAQVALGRDSLKAPWIDVELAEDGATVVKLDAKQGVRVDVAPVSETGARAIDARTLSAKGTAKTGLTAARFEGDVVFRESPSTGSGPPLEGTSRLLDLTLAGGLGSIESAEFRQDVKFTDQVVRAEAPRAVYDAAKDRLVLHPGAGPRDPRPMVQDERVRLWGDLVDINIGTHDMKASGRVETRSVPESATGPRRDAAGVFDRTREVLGAAPELQYANGTGRATYRSTPAARARVWQDANVVTADEISLDDATQNLAARGRVETDLEMAAEGGAGEKPKRHRIQSDTADFDQAARRAVFKGKRVELKSDDQDATGSVLELRLSAEARTLDGFTLTGDVEARLPGGHEALGERLVYDAAARTYTLTGGRAPVRIKSPGSEPGADCVLNTGSEYELDQAKNVVRRARGGSVANTINIPCSTPLRSIKW